MFLLKTEQAQLLQLFLGRELLQAPIHPHCPLLDPPQELHASLVLRSQALGS